MELERRTFSMDGIEIRADGDSKQIRGHAAVFDVLSENLGGFREKIAPGAFDGVLDDDVRALFNHDSNHILGRTTSKTLRVSVDSTGLGYEIDPPDTTVARDLMVSLERGDISQSSFQFTVEDDEWDEDDEGRIIRTITKIRRLYDVSPVTFAAYPDAKVALRGLDRFMEQREQNKTIPVSIRERELMLDNL